MAGQVPSVAPPAYADQMGQNFASAAEQRANILGIEQEAQSRNLGHILTNLEKIAKVGGGQLTPDRLLAAFAGSQEDIIDDQYSGMADRLRLAETQANIGRLSRSGRGGGGSGGGGPKPFTIGTEDVVLTNADGTQNVIRLREGDDLAETMRRYGMNPDTVVDVQFGVQLDASGQPVNGTGLAPNAFQLTPEDEKYLSTGE